MLTLSAQHLSDIEAHAERVYPEECCGLMLGTIETVKPEMAATQCGAAGFSRKVLKGLVALENQWTPEALTDPAASRGDEPNGTNPAAAGAPNSKRRRYWIDPKDMLRVQKQARDQGLSIIGVYHSHPDHVAEPSECDRALAWPEYAYIIVSVRGPAGGLHQGAAKAGNPAGKRPTDEAIAPKAEENKIRAVDVRNWALDSEHQFQPEPMQIVPSAAKDRMPVSA